MRGKGTRRCIARPRRRRCTTASLVTFSAGSAAMAASENGSRSQRLAESSRIWSNACGEAGRSIHRR